MSADSNRPVPNTTRAADPLMQSMLADYVSDGMPLIKACDALGLSRMAVYSNIEKDEKFRAAMEAARAIGYDKLAEECLAIADDTSEDVTQGKFGPVANKEFIARSRVRVDTRRWLLSKWHPKRYGEKLEVETHNRNLDVSISDDPIEAAKAYVEFMKNR